jgi:hypothetical protein
MSFRYKFISNSQALTSAEVAQKAASNEYRWWFECLRLSRVYKENCRNPVDLVGKALEVYTVFGRIRTHTTFEQWWQRRGRRVFAEVQDLRKVVLIDTRSTVQPDPRTFLLQIPKETSATTVKQHIRKLLRDYYELQPVNARENTTAIPLHNSRIKMRTVKRSLQIWDMAINQMPFAYLYEVGNQLEVSPEYVTKNNDRSATAREYRGFMSIAVSRYIRQAELLMANAAEGKFPSFDRNPKAQSRLRARRSALITDDI